MGVGICPALATLAKEDVLLSTISRLTIATRVATSIESTSLPYERDERLRLVRRGQRHARGRVPGTGSAGRGGRAADRDAPALWRAVRPGAVGRAVRCGLHPNR